MRLATAHPKKRLLAAVQLADALASSIDEAQRTAHKEHATAVPGKSCSVTASACDPDPRAGCAAPYQPVVALSFPIETRHAPRR